MTSSISSRLDRPLRRAAAGGEEAERRRDFRSVVLILLAGAVVAVPRTIQTMSIAKYRTPVGDDPAPYVPLADQALHLLTYALMGFCIWVCVEAVRDPPRGRLGVLAVMLLPWAYVVVRGLYQGRLPTSIGYLYPLLAVAVWVLRPRMALLRHLGHVVAAIALISILLALVRPTSAIFQNAAGVISEDKQILSSGLLIGIFTQANNLGQFLVMGIPAIWLIRNRTVRAVGLAAAVFALVWTASRGSMYAFGLSVVAFGVLRASSAPLRYAAAVVAGVLPMAVVVAIPLLTNDPLAFTNRGFIWQISIDYWKQDPWFGLGSNWYAKIGATTATLGATVYHGHNQMVQSLVTGGVVLVTLVGLLLLVAVVSAARLAEKGLVATVWLVAFGGSCLLEPSLVLVDNTFLLPVMVVPLAFLLFTADHHDDERQSTGRLPKWPRHRTSASW